MNKGFRKLKKFYRVSFEPLAKFGNPIGSPNVSILKCILKINLWPAGVTTLIIMTLGVFTFSITIFSTKGLFVTLSITTFSLMTQRSSHFAECHILFIVMLSVVALANTVNI
jgi:hypothetical protein